MVLLGVVVFVVLDVVLVALAIRSTDGGEAPDSASTPTSSPSTSAPATDEPVDEATNQAEPKRGKPLLLAAGANGSVLRAQPGSCDGPPARVSLSQDGGASFDSVDTGAQVVLRLSAASLSDMWVAGLNGDCNPTFFRSGDGGQSWEPTQGTQGAWHRVLGDEPALHAPDGRVELPCTPVALASVNFDVAVAGCDNGDVVTTGNRGNEWNAVGSVSDVVDLAFAGPQRGFALSVGSDCTAVVSGTTDGGSSWEELSCIDGPGRARAMALLAGGDLLVQTADQIHRSSDGGASWQQP